MIRQFALCAGFFLMSASHSFAGNAVDLLACKATVRWSTGEIHETQLERVVVGYSERLEASIGSVPFLVFGDTDRTVFFQVADSTGGTSLRTPDLFFYVDQGSANLTCNKK